MDDLVKRLRKRAHEPIACTPFNILMEAADRIAELEAKLAKAVEALTVIANHRKQCLEYDTDVGLEPRTFDVEDVRLMEWQAKATLAELTGGNDE